jgi:hypothetical protein
MMEAVRTSETSVDNYFTWQYIPEDKSELHIRRRENLKSHTSTLMVQTKTMSEMLGHNSILTPLIAREDFVAKNYTAY